MAVYKNGQKVAGGGILAIPITQAEYDALSEESKMSGDIYIITDAQIAKAYCKGYPLFGGAYRAEEISYDEEKSVGSALNDLYDKLYGMMSLDGDILTITIP